MSPDELEALKQRVQATAGHNRSLSVDLTDLCWLISRCEENEYAVHIPRRDMKLLPKLVFATKARQKDDEGKWKSSVYSSEDKTTVFKVALTFEKYRDPKRSEKPILYESPLDWMPIDPSVGTKSDVKMLEPLWTST